MLCVDATLSPQKAGGRRRSHSKGLERSDSFGALGATEQDEENGLHYITSGSPIKCCIFSISRESHESSLGFRIRKEQILKTPYEYLILHLFMTFEDLSLCKSTHVTPFLF